MEEESVNDKAIRLRKAFQKAGMEYFTFLQPYLDPYNPDDSVTLEALKAISEIGYQTKKVMEDETWH